MDYLKHLEYPDLIRSVSEFLSIIRGFAQKNQKFFLGNFICYRGQTQDWELVPTIFRDVPNDNTGTSHDTLSLVAEQELYREFRNKIRGFETKWDVDSPWELVCFAQHFGVPTRLLDWATNPLAALYFAVSTDVGQDYSVVWCMNVTKLDPNPQKNLPTAQTVYRDYERGFFLSDLSPETPFFSRLPHSSGNPNTQLNTGFAIVQPPDIDNRIKNQGGMFSVHISQPRGFVVDHGKFISTSTQNPNEVLLKLKIPIQYRRDILDELWNMGVTAYLVYPDLQGLGMYMKSVHQRRSNP